MAEKFSTITATGELKIPKVEAVTVAEIRAESAARDRETNMLDPAQWLEEIVAVRHEYGGETQMPRHRRLSFLVYANGGFAVRGWGVLTYGRHQQGLDQADALSLLEFNAYMLGAADAGVNLFEHFKPYFSAYVAEVEAALV